MWQCSRCGYQVVVDPAQPVLEVCPQCHAPWTEGLINPKPAGEKAGDAFCVFIVALPACLMLAWQLKGHWPGWNASTLVALLSALAIAVLAYKRYLTGCLLTVALIVVAVISAIL